MKYFLEFIGTFLMVLVGTGSIILNDVSGLFSHFTISLSFGLIVMIVVYFFGHLSGAHINPAVTIGFWFNKTFERKEVFPYILSQLFGAILASLVLFLSFKTNTTMGETIFIEGNLIQSFVLEFLSTFVLMFVILNVSTDSRKKRFVASVLIGSVVFFASIFVGPITGASMNPARTIGPAVFGESTYLWVYLISTILGSISSVYLYKMSKLISFKRKV